MSIEDNLIGIQDFAQVDLRVAEIIEAEKVEDTDKLLNRGLQIMAGITIPI